MTIPAHPLHWPEGHPRTTTKAASTFKTALPAALKNVRTAIAAFGRDSGKTVGDVVISSNVSLGNDQPADTGVALWFTWDGAQRCIAVDRYPKVQDNLQAIHHILEARRTEMRHGGLHIVRQTFRGFVALPAPPGTSWWEVLGVSRTADRAARDAAYQQLAKVHHPDKGGDRNAWDRLQTAYAAAKGGR